MATTASVQAARLRQLVVEERKALSALEQRVTLRRRAVQKVLAELEDDEERVSKAIESVDVRLRKLDEWKKEPVVLVRSTAGGYDVPVYHDAKEPCGYANNLLYPHRMLLAEAEEAGHGACSACGWKARRRRLAVAA